MKKQNKRGKISKVIAALMVVLMMMTGCSGNGNDGEKKSVKIGIVQIVNHPSLNQIRDNVVKQLNKDGYVDGKNCTIDIQDAQNEQSNLKTICQKFVNNDYDIIIPISTPAAQSAASETKEVPIVFSAVTDPIAAGLVENAKKPGGNITGVSDAVSAGKIMKMAKLITPNMKTIGVLYTSSEINSQSVVSELKEYAKKNNLEIEEAAVTASNEIQQGATKLASKADIVFSPNDNTVAAAMPIAVKVFNEAKIPFYVGADSMVDDGGLATDGVNYSELGKETAKMAVKVLKGEDPGAIPVMVMDKTKYYYNPDTAKTIEVKLPEKIIKNGEALTGGDLK